MELGVTYVAAHLPQHIAADMGHLRDIGCNAVMFALQENHLNYMTGALQFGAPLARREGLKPVVVIWGYANTFGGGRMSLVMLNDPEMWRVLADGTRTPRACLNNPKLVDHFLAFAARCRDAGFAGMFVDEPTTQECFCDHCRTAFHAKYGGDLAKAVGSGDYAAFGTDTIRHYTAEVCRQVKALDATLETSTCVMPHDHAAWEPVAAIPELDVFGTDPYWIVSKRMTLADAVADAQHIKAICQQRGKISQLWLNAWRIPAGREDEVYTGGKALAAVGCDSFFTWSYRGAEGTNEASDNPERTWASVTRLYRELAGR